MIALKFYHAHQSLNIANMCGNHIVNGPVKPIFFPLDTQAG